MPKKYYAVRVGRVPGVYDTWPECQEQVNGYSSAVYKGFKTRKEAENFLIPLTRSTTNALIGTMETQAVAYVDGSYDSATNTFSYGMVLFHGNRELHCSKKFTGSSLAKMHNVAGEIKGAEAAMQYCLDNGLTSVTIYHDYEGVAKWCTGEWKAKKAGTIAYAEFYREVCSKVQIRFVKVKGHSGDRYNELADRLAKGALGL